MAFTPRGGRGGDRGGRGGMRGGRGGGRGQQKLFAARLIRYRWLTLRDNQLTIA